MNNKIKHPLLSFFIFTFKCYPKYYLVALIKCIMEALQLIFNAYSLSILISYLEQSSYKYSLITGLVICLINFVFYFSNKLTYKLNEIEGLRLQVYVEKAIADKLMKVPFEYLEDPDFLDLKERANMGIYNMGAIINLINIISNIIQSSLVLFGLGAILTSFDYRLLIIMIVTLIADVILVSFTLAARVKFYQSLVPINRRFGYCLNTILDYTKGKDYRLNKKLGDMLVNDYITFEHSTIKEIKKFGWIELATEVIQKVIGYVQLMLVYILIASKVINNSLSISQFSLYISSAVSFTATILLLITASLNAIETVAYVTPVLSLMKTGEDREDVKKASFDQNLETLEFQHVYFKYPHSDNLILNDVSFKINKGEKISLVGLNGSGKTTIVKLITRLYQPTSGKILVNGQDINSFNYNSYIKHVSTVFQDFKLFAYSLKENILNSDGDEALAKEAAYSVGLKEKIDSLPEGINSLYNKSLDDKGIELSGGEAQKIAIARCICADADLIVLDEPTSALDPLSEASIYQNFNDLVKNKTALYISHRMSSSIFCDKILVLDGGSIVAFDTHSNLMKNRDGLYYRMFHEQAKNYSK